MNGESTSEMVGFPAQRRKPVVGLAGGVGSGKSTVASLFGELGAGVIESDALNRLELNSETVKSTLREWWGDRVFAADGSVDRRVVASVVFRDPAQRHRLEALLHPRIAVRRRDLMVEFERSPGTRMVVLDSPLLYETDLDLACDAVVFVDADPETRFLRSAELRGWTREEFERRQNSQHPLDIKRARADYIIENKSTLADLRARVRQVFDSIVSEATAA